MCSSTRELIQSLYDVGGYHFEVDDGRVRWFHRGHQENPVFSVITSDVIRPNTWYHVVGTYSSHRGDAKVVFHLVAKVARVTIK